MFALVMVLSWRLRADELRTMTRLGCSRFKAVQIMGADPKLMAEAARYNVDNGAQIIDINMGCPAKKVCRKAAGSALLADEKLVGQILQAVVGAVPVPVTLKIRTGWDPEHKNAVTIARIAEQAGIRALAVHGRTRACAYRGKAEHDTVRDIKSAVAIPVIANGDIATPERAQQVLQQTGADAVMIGRAAQGRPWIFREILHYRETGQHLPAPRPSEICAILTGHLENLYAFYGEYTGVRVARKHIAWYSKGFFSSNVFRKEIMQVECASEQLAMVDAFLSIAAQRDMAA